MTNAETIEQFVTNLEKNFDPNEIIDFSIDDLKYLHLLPASGGMVKESCTSQWSSKDQPWDFLVVCTGNTQVSDVITTLKAFLPTHKDDLMVMRNKNEYFSLFSSSVTVKKFKLDHETKYLYMRKHPKVIKHNKSFLCADFWAKFNSKMEECIKVKRVEQDDSKTKLKFARHIMFDYSITNPDFEISPPYFYLNKFYQTLEDVAKVFSGKDLKFCLSKGIMVVNTTPTEDKLYFIGSDSFTMKQLVEQYTLTETHLIKFFVEDDSKKFNCIHPEILKTFEK